MKKEEITKLLETLSKETMVMSSPTQMAETESYKKIESLGKEVVPFLIESLGGTGMPVIPVLGLLHRLTGETPFAPDKRGRVDEMIAAWKSWGKPKSIKEEAARIILESAKKREKKIAKPIPHEDIGDPNQKGFALESEQIDETITKSMSSGTVIHDVVHSKNKMFSHDSKKKRISRALAIYYRKQRGE